MPITMTYDQLVKFANSKGITVEAAQSLLKNLNWREAYRKEYNKRLIVKAKRQMKNKIAYELRKDLKSFASHPIESDESDEL